MNRRQFLRVSASACAAATESVWPAAAREHPDRVEALAARLRPRVVMASTRAGSPDSFPSSYLAGIVRGLARLR